MSIVISYSVGNGDMFSIRHNSDNFSIIDCSMSDENEEGILEALRDQSSGKGIHRFISTHPDQDHFSGLTTLDAEFPIANFYCVKNAAAKEEETEDFKKYCELRDSDKAFYIYKGCSRKWMSRSDDERGSSGIEILWPDRNNDAFIEALKEAEDGGSPNNISPVITYSVQDGAKFMWMGDLETDFLAEIEYEIDWPKIDVLFAPHHGRNSAKVPESILAALDPGIVVIGEASSEHLNYYNNYDTITQNSAGTIAFECLDGLVHVYVSNSAYSVNFLENLGGSAYNYYIGSLFV